jgi:hypothetical protein
MNDVEWLYLTDTMDEINMANGHYVEVMYELLKTMVDGSITVNQFLKRRIAKTLGISYKDAKWCVDNIRSAYFSKEISNWTYRQAETIFGTYAWGNIQSISITTLYEGSTHTKTVTIDAGNSKVSKYTQSNTLLSRGESND